MSFRQLPSVLSVIVFIAALTSADGVRAAIAGRPNAADVQAVESCLADEQKSNLDLDVCIGRVSSGCAENSQGTSVKEACTTRELLVWTEMLNRDFDRLLALLSDEETKQSLRDVQRDFFVEKLKRCTFERVAHKDSTESLLAASRCAVRSTARQDLWLREEIASFISN